MLLLAMDTSTPVVSVAIGDGASVLGEVNLAGGRRHAEQLAPAVRYLADELGVELDRLAAVAVGVGPGLFTGLRVGVTTAKTMAYALQVPVVGVPSLDLVAYPLRHTDRLVVVVVDARRREVFTARYRPVPGGVQRVSEYAVLAPAALAADLAAVPDELLLAGDGVLQYEADWKDLKHAEVAGRAHDAPSAAALVELAAARVEREDFVSPHDLMPLYLRRSDAEIEWERVRERPEVA